MSTQMENKTEEIELDSKKLQVGEKTYYIDMKENQRGKFIKLVESLGFGRMSRIVISIAVGHEFVDKLKEMNDYIEKNLTTELPSNKTTNEEGDNGDYPTIIYSSYLFAMNRRFYFDLREHKDGYRRLRISYVLKSKRINLSIVTDAVPSLLQIVEDYVERFSTDGGDNTQTSNNLKNDESVSRHFKNKLKLTTDKNDIQTKQPRQSGLIISERPAPIQQAVVTKNYSLEVVTGEHNAFVRITEFIGNNKKSTLHVPLEGCIAWKDAIVRFIDQITPEDISKAHNLRVALTNDSNPQTKKD